ncbi:histidine--tRNA ligase [Methyloceanibacter methanicus]|uniref:Histidine--tRNA ligase n=1 Tax=Methyloceanibacter methanicus TaxID=1774968 RepID=A0A1E3W2V9_9HYPH|nr:histidine--tRNA ligase [Methyloceanibacter methanicus]ODS00149.1 histidine--tRNA ligase [Methyloceanibacter methanicus]
MSQNDDKPGQGPDISRPEARLPKGLQDGSAQEIRATEAMLATIKSVFELYGFEPLATPAIEYTDALGKFLPDEDRPNAGVFSFQDDDEQWLSLRYDLTAPLARYVAENFQTLPKPFRRYQTGLVWRNEKPGPGRFRQFMQFDADTVGAPSVAADAELCMLAADTMEALGVPRGDYVVKVNSRKILDGVLDSIGVEEDRRLTVLRAIDKFDRLGRDGVELLLGEGRKDESGDFTKGAGLSADDINTVISSTCPVAGGNAAALEKLAQLPETEAGANGVQELKTIADLIESAGYADRILIDPSIVRGLEYYTGPVFETELTPTIKDNRGQTIRLGSVMSGGRYDGLVERFTGERAPATGISVGVSRLLFGLQLLGKYTGDESQGPVVVLVFDKDRMGDYQRMVQTLRAADIRAELYLGSSGMKAQMKYADKRGAPCVVIQGGDEKERGEVQIKDLALGATLTKIEDREEYLKKQAEAQFAVPEAKLVEAVRQVLSRQKT